MDVKESFAKHTQKKTQFTLKSFSKFEAEQMGAKILPF